MPSSQRISLAATGTTSTHTHGPVDAPQDAFTVALEFIIEVAGSTPTITWKLQGCFEDSTVDAAAGAMVDCQLLPSASDTSVATVTQTGVGTYVHFVSLANSRCFRKYQLVTSSNTNVTYRANLYGIVDATD